MQKKTYFVSAFVAVLFIGIFIGRMSLMSGQILISTTDGDKQRVAGLQLKQNQKTEIEDFRIDINTASAEELQEMPGIGPAISQAIIDYREKNGKYKTTEEILAVKGIGNSLFDRIKDYIKTEEGGAK